MTVNRAEPVVPFTDATLSSLELSDVPFTFDSDTTSYEVSVANDVEQTTVTATANTEEASYVLKLGEETDEDGTVELSVGSNVVSVEVTAEDGETTLTYTVTVTRAEAAPDPEPTSEPTPEPSSPPDEPEPEEEEESTT